MNSNAPLTFRWRWLVGFLLSLVLPSTQANDDLPLHPTQYRAVIDVTTEQANFSVRFDRPPEFFTLDGVGRPADSFEFFTDTASSDAIQSTFNGLNGTGHLGTQTIIGGYDIPTRRQVTIWWPKPVAEWIPDDPASQAVLRTYADYTVVGDTLSFSVPLSLLHDPDGAFNYGFQITYYGGWTTFNYYGVSGQTYLLPVPEPAHESMLGAGVMLLVAAIQRGRRQRRDPIMRSYQKTSEACSKKHRHHHIKAAAHPHPASPPAPAPGPSAAAAPSPCRRRR